MTLRLRTTPLGFLAGSGLTAMVAALAFPSAAMAQDAPPADTAQAASTAGTGSDAPDENEIVVTAQFREQRLQDTPIAITAVNAAMIEARGYRNIASIAAQAPNVSLTPQPQNGGTGLIAYIRGVGQTDFNFALEPGVGLYVDDVYLPTLTGSLLDLLDLDRVEILRGPQGTLSGRNSIGGAIKLFSKKAEGHGGNLSLTYGSYDRVDVRASGDFTLVDDKLFVRVAGVSKNRDGYVDRIDYGCSHPGSGVPTLRLSQGCKLGTLNSLALKGYVRANRSKLGALFSPRTGIAWYITDEGREAYRAFILRNHRL